MSTKPSSPELRPNRYDALEVLRVLEQTKKTKKK